MQDFVTSLSWILVGIGLVTIVDYAGSIISRELNFNYGYFSILSLVVYISVAYIMFDRTNNILATMIVALGIGIYDGSVGWEISKRLKANYGDKKDYAEKMTIAQTIFVANIFSIMCGFIGIYLASR